MVDTTVVIRAGGNDFLRCDSNADGDNNLADAIFTLTFLFSAGADAQCQQSMDCNGDTGIDLSDPIFDLNFLFSGGPGPLAPYPDCDTAATDDCAASTPCGNA